MGGGQVTWYDKIIEAHRAVTDQVSHQARMQSTRYFVWQEEGTRDLKAGGRTAERVMVGTTDLYTKQEFDPWAEQLDEALDNAPDVLAWRRESIQYEEETGFTHIEWSWEVLV